MNNKDVYYSEYLQLDKILDAQLPESRIAGKEAHDEMLFIIIHQSYELWFKQILHEIASVAKIFGQERIVDTSPDLQIAVHRLKRVVKILEIAVKQVDVIETMTPLDFLDFRDMLRPASGFQSIQFKQVEAVLGLKMEERFGKAYYTSQLKEEDKAFIENLEKEKTFIELLNDWLERMPFWGGDEYWDSYLKRYPKTEDDTHVFWQDYIRIYEESLSENEKKNVQRFKAVCFGSEELERRLSPKANRAALFIILYRDYPLLQMPYQLLNTLLDIDEQMATWRFRHINMVHRMIGARVGTGGSTGKDYLQAALNKHYIFKEIAELTSFLVERTKLPVLDDDLVSALSFGGKY
ncbi:MAG: tryptophan 2,3-dioxygenase [Chitinophagales bacterium]|nr:tryptophan 2,3-dioxygenase [Bacteroidota bacterium]MCB9255629.1 tryptophan 2,3-dioxygenase [Chitinophagales bacterium]